jgi:hypothetical protein
MMRESLMFRRYRTSKGAPVFVRGERSTTQRCTFDTVPELVACDAVGGRMMCKPWCFDIATWVDLENEGRLMPEPELISSWSCSAELSGVASLALSGCFSSDVGMNDEVIFDVSRATTATSGSCNSAETAVLLDGVVAMFLRDLKENFFGGLKELRMLWSFSDSVLIV